MYMISCQLPAQYAPHAVCMMTGFADEIVQILGKYPLALTERDQLLHCLALADIVLDAMKQTGQLTAHFGRIEAFQIRDGAGGAPGCNEPDRCCQIMCEVIEAPLPPLLLRSRQRLIAGLSLLRPILLAGRKYDLVEHRIGKQTHQLRFRIVMAVHRCRRQRELVLPQRR